MSRKSYFPTAPYCTLAERKGASELAGLRAGRGARHAGAGAEEQGLADQRADGVRLERLRYEERRLGALAGEQAFREGRDEDDGHVHAEENLVHGLEP